MLRLPALVRAVIIADCTARRPEEACGLLIGRDDRVTEAVVVENAWPVAAERPTRFAIDPLVQMKVEAAAIAAGQELIGFYHSHPIGPAVPSDFDTERAWPVYHYLIVGLSDMDNIELREWTLDAAGAFVEHVVDIL